MVNFKFSMGKAPFSPSTRLDRFHSSHIGAQHVRDRYRAVGLLVIFQDRHQGPADRQARAVEGMYELRLAALFPAKANAGTACLEVPEIGAGRDLPVGLL